MPVRHTIRRSIDIRRVAAGADSTASFAAALAAGDLAASLSRWIGIDGCHAVFSRAKSEAESSHAALRVLSLRVRAPQYVEGVGVSVEQYGDTETADGIESMLVGVSELLGRLVGSDMAKTLIEQNLPESAQDDAAHQQGNSEA